MRAGIERQWLIPAYIVLGLLCLFFIGSKLALPTDAEAQPQTDTKADVLVIPVQLARDSYGLAMVDTVGQTLWIYQLNSYGPAYNRLRLIAARSWRYDKLLKQYNTTEPKPEQVKILLEKLGQQNKEEPEQSDTNILEIASPNSSNSATQ
jgi:hypothetical protein